MKSLALFNIIFYPADPIKGFGSQFRVEGTLTTPFPSAMIRRNFPQAKDFTRLAVRFHDFAVDKGRTLWLKCDPYGEITYTFSRRGKVIHSTIPITTQKFLQKSLHIKKNSISKIKMEVEAI